MADGTCSLSSESATRGTALPSGFSETNVYAQAFDAPAADCDVPDDVQIPTSFNASWSNGSDGWLSFNVFSSNAYYYPEDEFRVGYSNDYSVSWSDGTLQYEIYGNDNRGGLGAETLEAIARAVDPNFDQSCRLIEREFTQAELAAVGISWPTTPDGYELVETHTSGSEQTAGCGADVGTAYFSGNWTFETDGSGVLHAYAWFNERSGEEFIEGGYIGQNHMSWQAANGVRYSIEAWSKTNDEGDRDAMIEVARSLDPDIDIDSFKEEPDVEARPLPAPVDGAASTSSSDGDSLDDY